MERLCNEISLQKSLAQNKNAKYFLRSSESSLDDRKRHLDLFIKNHKALKNKTIKEEWPDGDFTLHTDRLLVSRVLGNMIVNALEATQEGGSISLKTKIEGDHFVWEVWNSAFIDESIQKRIFQRHFSTKSEFGHGLVKFRNPRPMGVVMWVGYADPEWAWLKAHSLLFLNSSCSRNTEKGESSEQIS